jgi:hypothetical protein
MNSLKSLCRCAKRAPMAFDQLEQQVETFLGCQIGVELIVGLVGSIKARENPCDALHFLSLPDTRAHQEPPPPPRAAHGRACAIRAGRPLKRGRRRDGRVNLGARERKQAPRSGSRTRPRGPAPWSHRALCSPLRPGNQGSGLYRSSTEGPSSSHERPHERGLESRTASLFETRVSGHRASTRIPSRAVSSASPSGPP